LGAVRAAEGPDGAPNVVYIVLDDVGFSAMSCYGGPIETPNIERIAADGIRYAQWSTTTTRWTSPSHRPRGIT
jgi:arylsulfatase A-like enzyme